MTFRCHNEGTTFEYLKHVKRLYTARREWIYTMYPPEPGQPYFPFQVTLPAVQSPINYSIPSIRCHPQFGPLSNIVEHSTGYICIYYPNCISSIPSLV